MPDLGFYSLSFSPTSYLRDFSKLRVSLAALLSCLHSQLVVVHKCSVDSQLTGLVKERERERCGVKIWFMDVTCGNDCKEMLCLQCTVECK